MKKITLCLGIFALITFLTSTVYAYNQNSGYHSSPEAYAGQTKYGPKYSLSSAYAPITGAETAVYFKSLGTLRDTVCVRDTTGQRYMNIYLLEDDVVPNEDEKVKFYQGSFEDWQLSSIVYKGYGATSSSGNIESSSDATGEFYISMYLSYMSGDKTTTNGTMFSYDIRVD